MTELLWTGPDDADATLLLAHGAGAPMDSPFMTLISDMLAMRGIRVARFEFTYMAARRKGGKRRPPPKAETLDGEMTVAARAAAAGAAGKLAIGGKSMGGRVASHVAENLHKTAEVAGLVCLGYPFHPPNTPERLRVAHLETLTCPTLIIQGERDPFGTRAEVEALTLPPAVRIHWAHDGDHDLGPRGGSGTTRRGNLEAAADAIAAFLKAL
ncbi:MAG: dienelactone hydrolase family protein [Hyphomicrobium sp.]|nr:dienelactone hydrolase family protein [Hyphomicrobium sp.]MBN9265103.1 dienelactone hydrolase family protein [Hyphomicrobium sp.]